MIIVKINEDGVKSINLDECKRADELLKHRLLLDSIAGTLQRLDVEIQSNVAANDKE